MRAAMLEHRQAGCTILSFDSFYPYSLRRSVGCADLSRSMSFEQGDFGIALAICLRHTFTSYATASRGIWDGGGMQ